MRTLPTVHAANKVRGIISVNRVYACVDHGAPKMITLWMPTQIFTLVDGDDVPLGKSIDLSLFQESELGRVGAYLLPIDIVIDTDDSSTTVSPEVTKGTEVVADGRMLSHFIPIEE